MKEQEKNQIIIYTDGCSLGNPGTGGYGAVLIFGSKRKELSQGFRLTTNNRMEILASIEALRVLKKNMNSSGKSYDIIINTDSQLLRDTIEKKWAVRWRQNNWKRNKRDAALNPDLWDILLKEIEFLNKNGNTVRFQWVPAHTGIPENELCDELANKAASNSNLKIDEYYEQTQSKS